MEELSRKYAAKILSKPPYKKLPWPVLYSSSRRMIGTHHGEWAWDKYVEDPDEVWRIVGWYQLESTIKGRHDTGVTVDILAEDIEFYCQENNVVLKRL